MGGTLWPFQAAWQLVILCRIERLDALMLVLRLALEASQAQSVPGARLALWNSALVSVAEHVEGLRERGGGICRRDLSSDCLLWRFTNFFKKTLPLQWVEMQFVGATRNQTSRGNARNSLMQWAQGGGGIRATLKRGAGA